MLCAQSVKVKWIAAGPAACHSLIGDASGRCWTWGRNEVGHFPHHNLPIFTMSNALRDVTRAPMFNSESGSEERRQVCRPCILELRSCKSTNHIVKSNLFDMTSFRIAERAAGARRLAPAQCGDHRRRIKEHDRHGRRRRKEPLRRRHQHGRLVGLRAQQPGEWQACTDMPKVRGHNQDFAVLMK